MQFIRENVFYVVLIGVVVFGGAIAMAVDFSVAGDVAGLLADRQTIENDLVNLRRAPKVNKAILDEQSARVTNVKTEAARCQQDAVDWNKRNYAVLQWQTVDRKMAPAFPADENLYLKSTFSPSTQAYIAAYDALVKALRPTTPPTAQDVDERTAQWLRVLQHQADVEKKNAAPSPSPSPARSGGAIPPPAEGRGYARPVEGVETLAAVTSAADIQAQAKERAITAAKLARAESGAIFVTPDALDKYYTMETVQTDSSRLWAAQLNLWATADILGAIGETNEDVFKSRGIDPANSKEATVPNAGVKQLKKIEINRDYTLNRGGVGMSSAPHPAGALSGTPPAPGGSTPSAGSLTGRHSTREYDVLGYRLTLIMPLRYLPVLQRRLLEKNYHTVLSVQIADAGDVTKSEYYYGPDAVSEVRIEGELLLLTAWERGQWDESGGQAKPSEKYPPLMPVKVLQMIGTADPGLLRAQDQKVLGDAGKAPAAGGRPAPSGQAGPGTPMRPGPARGGDMPGNE